MGNDLKQNRIIEGKSMYCLAGRLFPICRSITGDGVRTSIKILDDYLGEKNTITLNEIPTGTKVFDWTVPKEWKIRDAFIKNEDGKKIIDFKKNNLHVVNYSLPIDKWVNLEELQEYIFTQIDQPDVIPYVTSYYKEISGFCMSEKQRKHLKPGKYHLYIDSELFDGNLTYGETFLPGEKKEEIFFSTYICHPSMANNECSGPALLAELIKYVSALKKRRYSYRFVIVPETIGAITYLATYGHLKQLQDNVVAGFVLSCVGDDNDYSIVESRYADTLADKVLTNALNYSDICKGEYSRYSFLKRGSDERQYGSPGVDLPLVTFCRTKFHVYPQYHTSADDMDFISPQGFQGSYDVMKLVIDILENNFKYRTAFPCEPQLGIRGLYPTISQKNTKVDAAIMQDILAYADGRNDLIELSDKLGVPTSRLIPLINKLENCGVIIKE